MALPIPRFEPKTHIHAMIEAVEYFNSCIYPDLLNTLQIGPASFIYKITPTLFQKGIARPDYLRLGIVCTAVSHRLNRTRNSLDSDEYCTLEQKFLHYRGAVIQSLSHDIGEKDSRCKDITLAGIITLLLADGQQGIFIHRRWHLEGLQKLIKLRGGVRSLGKSDGVKALLLCLAFIIVIGDTTSPASELFMTTSILEDVEFILDEYGCTEFAFSAFPTPLFAEVIKINHLRYRVSNLQSSNVGQHLVHEAHDIIHRIEVFSPEQWATSRVSSTNDLLLLGNIYQVALMLYCICSLQSLSVLPKTCSPSRDSYRRLLHVLLTGALLVPRLKIFLFWPLVVLGMEAVNGDELLRGFVREQMVELSRSMGTSVPRVAKPVLEGFWASGKTGWDDCFDKPYGFVTSLALERSKLE